MSTIPESTVIENSDEAYAAIDALSDRQRDVLGAIAMNQDGGHHRKTIASLVGRGLIDEHEQTLGGRWPIVVKRYTVPLHVHIAWCQWCTDSVIDDEANE